jgi:hypothetical protein
VKPLFGTPTYARQNLLLAALFAVLLLAVYRINIRRTLALRARHAELVEQRQAASRAPGEIVILESSLEMLQGTSLRPYDRARLLERTAAFCRAHGLLIRGFPEEQAVRAGEFTVITNHLELEGDYPAMVRLAYLLEQDEQIGNINSLSFYLYEDRYEKTQALRGRLVLRNVIR